ncbi:putative ras [Achaetomium macrosporum]|uniref:Ras n=1 Tax=Achaetomium macrosporum TaxID=79813 RepID=A0AAN7HF95_9PEZI|nr:putative ras [Achaetomium macrosporum]
MATSQTTRATLRSLYRSLLRELPPRPILSSPRAPLHQRLRDNFQSTQPSSSSGSSDGGDLLAAQAEQYLAYLRAQRTYVTLLERYNPGMGMDEEERVRLTARRVGMDLPVEYGGEEDGEPGKNE